LGGTEIRPYREGDGAAINDGFNAVFGLERSTEEWAWKFAAADLGIFIVVAAEAGGQIDAHYGALPVRFQIDGRETLAGVPVDVYSRPVVRQGLGAARTYLQVVTRFFAEYGRPDALALMFGFPGERAFRLGVARLGYDEMPPQEVLAWTRPVRRRGWSWPRYRLIHGFDAEAIDVLWRRAAHRYPVAVVRDGRRWVRRYCNHPRVRYRHLAARRRGRTEAACVVAVESGVARVVDLLWDGAAAAALAALDRGVDAVALEDGAERAEMWLMGDEDAVAAMTDGGWVVGAAPQGLRLVARSFDPSIDPSSFPGRFYVTLGDSDLA